MLFKRIIPQIAFLLLFLNSGIAQPVILKGNNKTYKGFDIHVYTIQDYITYTPVEIGHGIVSDGGDFHIEVNINSPCKIRLDLEAICGLLYVEPGKTYQILIPDFTPINMGNRLNPFFKPTDFYLGLKNPEKNDINLLIGQFDDIYNEYVEDNYYQIFKSPKESAIEKDIANIEKLFDTIPSHFFTAYREYKYAQVRFLSYMRDSRYIIREYYNNGPFLYENPAYMDLFNQLFANYLSFYMNTREGERIYSDIALAKSPFYAKQTLSNNMAVKNDTLKDLILLKGIHDAFYSHDFETNSLLITLDSIEYLTKIPFHKQIAKNIRIKCLQAKEGTKAPLFNLYDKDGVMRSLATYKANYVYLNFFSIDSYSCQQDLELLKNLYEKQKDQFKVISISIDDDFDRVKSYFAQHGYDWILMSYKNQPEIITQYKVKAYPTYFLIDTNGILNMSPAPSPGENFEYRFFQLLKSREAKKTNSKP